MSEGGAVTGILGPLSRCERKACAVTGCDVASFWFLQQEPAVELGLGDEASFAERAVLARGSASLEGSYEPDDGQQISV